MTENQGERNKMVPRLAGKGGHERDPGGRNKVVPRLAGKGLHERGPR